MLRVIYHHLDEHVETYLATALLMIFTGLAILQVIMRYVFGNSLSWSEELSRYAFVWFVYTSASYAVRYQRHVKFNVVVDLIGRASPLAERLLRLIALLVWALFLVVLLVLAVELVKNQMNGGQISPANQIPMWVVYLGLPIGLALMSFRVFQHLVRSAVGLFRHPHTPLPRPTGGAL
jgi:TRAP-type C4-dicarboxylate transport system permease small subunit